MQKEKILTVADQRLKKVYIPWRQAAVDQEAKESVESVLALLLCTRLLVGADRQQTLKTKA